MLPEPLARYVREVLREDDISDIEDYVVWMRDRRPEWSEEHLVALALDWVETMCVVGDRWWL